MTDSAEKGDLVERLNAHCVGHPYSKIEWPHRLLHDSRDEIERLRSQLASARETLAPSARFVLWALMEGSWQGGDIDGGAAQDKAIELGLIVKTTYDPAKHGEADCDPGDAWYVASETLRAALKDNPQ